MVTKRKGGRKWQSRLEGNGWRKGGKRKERGKEEALHTGDRGSFVN